MNYIPEIFLESIRPQINRQNGQFLKGHEPFNKGKKWSDYMDMRKAKRIIRIAKKNLRGRYDIGGWNKKAVVAIKNGEFYGYFESCVNAADRLQVQRRNVSHVANGKRKRCGGYEFYFESDFDKWNERIIS